MIPMNKKRLSALLFASALALSACTSETDTTSNDSPALDGGDFHATTSFYPLTFLVEEIGGDNVTITDLTPPGADAHGVELSPREVADLENSDLVVYIERLSPAVDSAIEASGKDAVNIGQYVNLLPYDELGADPHAHDDHDDAHDDHDHDHGTYDPHFWTDPGRMILAADQIAAELIELDPDNEATYTANLDQVTERLQGVVDGYESIDTLQCRTDAFLVSHKAFAYMALEYDLVELGIAGFDPEIEPSPARVREITELAIEYDLDSVFATSDAEMRTAAAIGDEADLETLVLDPASTQRAAELDYVDVMEENLVLLRQSMGC